MLAPLPRERRTGKGGEAEEGRHGQTGEATAGLAQDKRQEHKTPEGPLAEEELEAGRGQLLLKTTLD